MNDAVAKVYDDGLLTSVAFAKAKVIPLDMLSTLVRPRVGPLVALTDFSSASWRLLTSPADWKLPAVRTCLLPSAICF
jgi:hypothetical protein